MTCDIFWCLKPGDIINILILLATIGAIMYGPIKAVSISRANDEIREHDKRRLAIFSALLRTRRAYMLPDHVWALNLIQLEFQKDAPVIATFKSYIANLAEPLPAAGGNDLENFIKRRNDLFYDLLHEIAKAVKCEVDKSDLERLGYVPYGWETENRENQEFRRLLLEVLQGKRPIPLSNFSQPSTYNPYPPPPT